MKVFNLELEIRKQMDIQANTVLYLYSTVPQVLGALLALLGVFILRKLEIMRKRLTSYSQNIISNKQNNKQKYNDNNLQGVFDDIKKEIKTIKWAQIGNNISSINEAAENLNKIIQKNEFPVKHNELIEFLKEKITGIKTWYNKILRFRSLIRQILIVNGSIIFIFLALFIYMPKINSNNSYFDVLVITGIIFAGISLFTMVNFLIKSLSDTDQKSIFTI